MPDFIALQEYWAEWGPPADVLVAAYFKMGKGGKRRPKPRPLPPSQPNLPLAARAKAASVWGQGRDLGELLTMFPMGHA